MSCHDNITKWWDEFSACRFNGLFHKTIVGATQQTATTSLDVWLVLSGSKKRLLVHRLSAARMPYSYWGKFRCPLVRVWSKGRGFCSGLMIFQATPRTVAAIELRRSYRRVSQGNHYAISQQPVAYSLWVHYFSWSTICCAGTLQYMNYFDLNPLVSILVRSWRTAPR